MVLQGRLVKEMRLSGIDTLGAGNAFLPAFIEKYNARFAKAPCEDRDVHRALVAGRRPDIVDLHQSGPLLRV
jgi:sugar/nucleoside kinase (ribokinase family)